MKIEQFENLIEVVKTGSINAAAKKIFVSQQNLNKSLHKLENELGVQIFNRTNKGVTLTKEGEIIYRGVTSIVKRYYEMLEAVGVINENSSVNQMSGKISVYISPMLSISLLSKAFITYMHKYPNIKVYCQEKYREEIIEEVSDDTSNAGLLLVPEAISDFQNYLPKNVELYFLKKYPIYMAVSPRHPLSGHQKLSLSTIADYPLIVYEAGGIHGVHAFQNKGDFEVRLSTNNYFLCQEMLAEGEVLMYSFPPFVERSIFNDFVHIPVIDEDAFFNCFLAINTEASTKERKIIDSFSLNFQEYL